LKFNILNVVLSILLMSCGTGVEYPADLLEQLMQAEGDRFEHILKYRDSLEVQIVYTQIDRDSANTPTFKSYYFNVDSSRYFYPASTVKLPLVLLSLEKLRRLNIEGVDMHTPMYHDSAYSGQVSVKADSTSETGLPSIAHYSKKILIVSDNDAYNRLYEFVGQKEINKRMKELSFASTRIIHRLERPLSRDENAHTEAVKFLKNGLTLYQQPMLINETPITVDPPVLKGKGFIRNDSLIKKPFDFTYKNFFPLTEQHKLLKRLIFPQTSDTSKKFRITSDDRAFVLKYMSQLPDETRYPAYDSDSTFSDAYCKFLMFGGKGTIPKNIRVFNKVGDAYGYLIDNAFVVDFENKVEFMLSAVINTNTDGIYNDGKYAYETLGFPFMKNLGQLIYKYEVKRERKFKPDLSEYVFKYDQ
jgi:hypothetical protein